MLNYRNVGTIWNQFLPKDTGYILLQNHRTDIHYTSASFQWCDSTIETHEINQTFLLDTNHNAVNSNEKLMLTGALTLFTSASVTVDLALRNWSG